MVRNSRKYNKNKKWNNHSKQSNKNPKKHKQGNVNSRCESFFGCTFCPNRVFSSGKLTQIHMNEHSGIIQTIPQFSQPSTNEDYHGSDIEEFDEYESFEEGTGKQTKQVLCQNWQPFSNAVAQSRSRFHKITLPKAETFLEMSFLSSKMFCKLCNVNSLFDDRRTAEEHIKIVHRFIVKEDLISQEMKNFGNGPKLRHICKVCSANFRKIGDVIKHYPEHQFLYEDEQSEYKDLLKIEAFLSLKFSCNLCTSSFVRPKKFIRMHMWESHFNEIQENMDAIRATEKRLFIGSETDTSDKFTKVGKSINIPQCSQGQYNSNEIPFRGSESQTKIDYNNYLIPKDILTKVGITENSNTGIVVKKIEQPPNKVYSCCFCPHEVLFGEDKNRHLEMHGIRPEEYHNALFAEVPLDSLIESRTKSGNFEVVGLLCVCQFTQFNRQILSSELLDRQYKQSVSPDDTPISGEEKLLRLYKYQFVQHNNYKLSCSKIEHKECRNLQKVTGNRFYSMTVVDVLDIGEINSVEISELSTRKKFIVMRNLLREAKITNESKSSRPQNNSVPKLPEVIFSCFLCPHMAMLHTKAIENHMARRHKLTRGYDMLLAAVPTSYLIKETYQHPGNFCEFIVIDCVCQYTVFSADVLSLPIIDTTYKERILTTWNLNLNKNIDTKAKLLEVYKNTFECHNPQKFIIKPNMWAKKFFGSGEPKSHLKILTLHHIQEIPTSTKNSGGIVVKSEPVTPQLSCDKPSGSVNKQMIVTCDTVGRDVVAVRDLLNKVGITKDRKHLDREITLQKMPRKVFVCCLCPHVPMFLECEVRFHLFAHHKITMNWSFFISAPIPTRRIKDYDSFQYYPDTVLDCPCQYAVFDKRVLSTPVIDKIYKETVSNGRDEEIDAETKLSRYYQIQFTDHYKYRLLTSRGVKRHAESISTNTDFKVFKSHERTDEIAKEFIDQYY